VAGKRGVCHDFASPAHLTPLHETFFMIAAICALAMGATMKMRVKPARAAGQ
jgi:hypothetical protein